MSADLLGSTQVRTRSKVMCECIHDGTRDVWADVVCAYNWECVILLSTSVG